MKELSVLSSKKVESISDLQFNINQDGGSTESLNRGEVVVVELSCGRIDQKREIKDGRD